MHAEKLAALPNGHWFGYSLFNCLVKTMFGLNPFLSITIEHLSYLSQVIEIWILEYLV